VSRTNKFFKPIKSDFKKAVNPIKIKDPTGNTTA